MSPSFLPQGTSSLESSNTALSEQVKKLEEALAAERKKAIDAKDEALNRSKSIADMQSHVVENNMSKDEVSDLKEQIQRMEAQLKENELDSVFLTSENDSNKKVVVYFN